MTRPFTPPPLLVLLGEELRLARKARGLTQEQLANRVYCTNSLISMLELAQRVPKLDLIERLDAALDCQGRLVRLWKLVDKEDRPRWESSRVEAEENAVAIRSWQPTTVHGFLQTARYARALFRGGIPGLPDEEKLTERLERRLRRQETLTGGTLASFHVIAGEALLYQLIGGAEVMREQLVRLIELIEQRLVAFQFLRFDVAAAGLAAPMTIYDLADGERAVYLERATDGQTTTDADTIQSCAISFDTLRSQAAGFDESARIIKARIEEL